MASRITYDTAEAILKMVEADAVSKIKGAGARTCWTKIGRDGDAVVLIVKVYTDEGQTKLGEYIQEPEE